MFGIGPTELVIIVLLLVVVFGPGKAISMARDFGRFVSGAQNTVEEFKGELLSQEEIKEAHHTAKEFKDEARHSLEELRTKVAVDEEGGEHSSDPLPSNDADEAYKLEERRKPAQGGSLSS